MSRFNCAKGLLSFDALFSILPLLLMIFYILNVVAFVVKNASDSAQQQILFDKVVSVADYAVKHSLAKKSESARWPNLVRSVELNENELNELKSSLDFKKLSVGEEPTTGTCVYRLILLESSLGVKQIKKVYVCGE
jgi:hypothetical protein